jgi:hypothetical protein
MTEWHDDIPDDAVEIDTVSSPACAVGQYGRKVCHSFRLSDGRRIDMVCDFGWLYRTFVFTAEEETAALTHIPYTHRQGWNEL